MSVHFVVSFLIQGLGHHCSIVFAIVFALVVFSIVVVLSLLVCALRVPTITLYHLYLSPRYPPIIANVVSLDIPYNCHVCHHP